MSTSISGDYSFSLDYSSLFNTSSSTSSSYQASNYTVDYSNYGTNSSTLTDDQVSEILGFKNAANSIQQSLSTLLNKKNDGSSIFGDYSATSSDSDALTATYNNSIGKYSSEALLARRDPNYRPSAPEELSVKTVQLAQTQKNTGTALDTKGMELEAGKTYSFEISDSDKTTTISVAVEAGDTNESFMKKIASAINEKDIGVKASVNVNDFTGTSSINLESRETGINDGQERAFEIGDVSGDAAEKLGMNNMTQEAQNAKYYVKDKNGSEMLHESKSNTVSLTDRTSATLKKTTDDYVDIGFDRNTTPGVNAVRDLVNGFNTLFDAASSGSTTSSSNLARQLSGLADTYSKALSEVGITRNEYGYFEIDEDKMNEAAKSGALENLFSSDNAGQSYGFANRLSNIAKTAADNPTQYVVSKMSGYNSDASSRYSEFMEKLNSGSSEYSKLIYDLQKYDNIGSLFSSMF